MGGDKTHRVRRAEAISAPGGDTGMTLNCGTRKHHQVTGGRTENGYHEVATCECEKGTCEIVVDKIFTGEWIIKSAGIVECEGQGSTRLAAVVDAITEKAIPE